MHIIIEEITEFLTNNVIGKTLKTDETIYYLDDGKLEGVYSDEMTFSNILASNNGFHFDMTTVTHEKVYSMDKNKTKRTKVMKDFTGTSVFHYEFSLRKSTDQITGIMRLLSSTVQDHAMEAVAYGIYDCELASEELSWKEQQLLYRDMPAENNVFRPVAFDSKIRFFFENAKLRFEYAPTYYNVDPVTLEKQLSKDQYPVFLSKEK